MVFSALVIKIIFLFLKSWGQLPVLRSIQYITFKYGDFQKASRISLPGPYISINSIATAQILHYSDFSHASGNFNHDCLPCSFSSFSSYWASAHAVIPVKFIV